MKKTIKVLMISAIVAMSFVIGVKAGGRWKGTEVVNNIRTEQVQTIRDLFTTKNNKITELETGNTERIRELELQIDALNETVVLKDREIADKNREIVDKEREIIALENELTDAYNDVLGIQTDLGQIIIEQGN